MKSMPRDNPQTPVSTTEASLAEKIGQARGALQTSQAANYDALLQAFFKIADENPNNADLSVAEKEEMRVAIAEDVAELFRPSR